MSIIKYPLATEKGIRAVESENKIIFVVEKGATKEEIKQSIEKMLSTKVVSVNTQNGPDGEKIAYVRFSNATPAIDIATKLGMM
jgi:large subunit ribosomal protein L23